MTLKIRKKSSYVFSPPSYIKNNGALESKVEKIINDTIKEKIFNLLEINRPVYIKLIEYFPVFTSDVTSSEKIVHSIMMRIKNRHFDFREIKAKEIELSGIDMLEFYYFLESYGAKELLKVDQILKFL